MRRETHLQIDPHWAIWRWSSLRGAGFPAAILLELASDEAADAADRVLDAESEASRAHVRLKRVRRDARRGDEGEGARLEEAASAHAAAAERLATESSRFRDAYPQFRSKTFRAAQELTSSALLREAITWQNRAALPTAIDPLRACDPAAPRSGDRAHEELLAKYLQRYCVKNDTIGFFGPIGWARVEGEDAGILVKPGPALVAQRGVHFEQWAIDRLAAVILSQNPGLERWLVPRRLPFVRIDGDSVVSAVSGKAELTAEELRVLRECDGTKTAADMGEEAQPALRSLRDKKLVAWTLEAPLAWDPESHLRAALERVGDAALRANALRPLDELEAARRAVHEAAGDAVALEAALVGLDETFHRLTGSSTTRHAGDMYAARQLVFEDCVRDVEVTVGADLVRGVWPALSLLLTSARWLSLEVARRQRQALRAIHAQLASKGGPVRFSDVWFRAQRTIFGANERSFDEALVTFQDRWSKILGTDGDRARIELESSALRDEVLEAFAAPGAGWHGARHHSPDLMIAAKSVDAIRRGDYAIVLGELHVASNTLDTACFLAQHPRPSELVAAFERDRPDPIVMPVYPKDWPRVTVRTNRAFMPDHGWFLASGFDPSPVPQRTVALADLEVVSADGELLVRGPSGFEVDILEVFGDAMSRMLSRSLRLLPTRAHQPRITIDRLVVVRETWSVEPSAIPFVEEADEGRRFLAMRRWARTLALPRFFFVKAPNEVKPLFVDLDSPVFVSSFTKLVRRARKARASSLTFTEMLPLFEDLWLTDSRGQAYTSELRIVAVDACEVAR